MVKLIVIVLAAIAFWFYASSVFFDTFVDESPQQKVADETKYVYTYSYL